MHGSDCEKLSKLVADARRETVSLSKLLKKVGRLGDIVPCISQGLSDATEAEDWQQFGLYVVIASRHPSSRLVDPLCRVLDQHLEWVNNEDIVDVLGLIGDDRAIRSLRDAYYWQPEWDDYRSLAKKCLMALAEIGSPAAREVLQEVKQSGPDGDSSD